MAITQQIHCTPPHTTTTTTPAATTDGNTDLTIINTGVLQL